MIKSRGEGAQSEQVPERAACFDSRCIEMPYPTKARSVERDTHRLPEPLLMKLRSVNNTRYSLHLTRDSRVACNSFNLLYSLISITTL